MATVAVVASREFPAPAPGKIQIEDASITSDQESKIRCQHKDTGSESFAAFPSKLVSALCWKPESFPLGSSEYVSQFDSEEMNSIERAVAHFKGLNLRDIAMISPDNFPLPDKLASKLRAASATLHDGRGFAVLRGLKPDKLSNEDSAIAFCGIGSYIGINRAASENGIGMSHLRDASKDPKPSGREHVELHPSKLMAPLKFHADRKFADILALFVKSKAAIGGQQYLSSFWTVYNEMMKDCPEYLQVLSEDFPWPGVVNDLPETTYTPVIFHNDQRVMCQLVYRVFEKTDLLSERQWKALNSLERIATECAIELDVQPGDIQLVNNLAILHARKGWVDRPGAERHYYRLGLHDPERAWGKPAEYENSVFYDHLNLGVDDQTIPITDYDPYGMTSLDEMGHG